jgi:Protein of unknown function DUF262
MQRRTTTQDVSWFIDCRRNQQLDLNPPYQRRSVWNPKDRRFFLDTVFRGYPCPAVFLHKTQNADQQSIYAVVDGKQRLQTLFMFVEGEIALAQDFGDARFNGKKWTELGSAEKQILWNYVVPVEFLIFDSNDQQEVNQAFDRLNRNMRKLEAQELRHARWDGWFITLVETECADPIWQKLGIVTKARSKRMKDAQFISELLLILIEKKQHGFDQQMLDDIYAKYDDLEEGDVDLDADEATEQLAASKKYMADMQDANGCVKAYAGTFSVFYSLWAAVTLHRRRLGTATVFATKFASFMEKVRELDAMEPETRATKITRTGGEPYRHPLEFLQASKGATTDLTPREKRLTALLSSV